ncbi:hypothetical protein HDU76_007899, partial [Blyttiomyces sp. JEL0837]
MSPTHLQSGSTTTPPSLPPVPRGAAVPRGVPRGAVMGSVTPRGPIAGNAAMTGSTTSKRKPVMTLPSLNSGSGTTAGSIQSSNQSTSTSAPPSLIEITADYLAELLRKSGVAKKKQQELQQQTQQSTSKTIPSSTTDPSTQS